MSHFNNTNSIHVAVSVLLLFGFMALGFTSALSQQKLYYVHSVSGKVQRINPDGSGLEDVLTTRLDEPTYIKVDTVTQDIYWAENGKVMRLDETYTNSETVVSLASKTVEGIALDVSNDKIYWCNASDEKIQRSNLDGSEIEDVVGDLDDPKGIAIDPVHGKVYWTGSTYDGGFIRRANLDGTDTEDMVTSGIWHPHGITLDLVNGKMYWADMVANTVQRANLDGTDVEEVIGSDLENPVDVVLNKDRTKIYWMDRGASGADGKLQRANIDGSEVEDIVTGLDHPYGLSIDSEKELIVWIDNPYTEPAYIGRINTDGANETRLLVELSGFKNLKVNETEQKLYWMDYSSQAVYKAELDGSVIEQVVETDAGNDFVLDPENQDIYWSENHAIRKAHLDGTEVQDLITTDLDEPSGLIVDIAAVKMYWIDGGYDADRIKWADLDGSDNKDLITDLDQPLSIQLDHVHDKIYWLEGGSFATELRRANKDGTVMEDVISDGSGIQSYRFLAEEDLLFWSGRNVYKGKLNGSEIQTLVDFHNSQLTGLTVDESSSKLYWNEDASEDDALWHTDFDGSEAEALLSGLPSNHDREIVLAGVSSTGITNDIKAAFGYHLAAAYPNPFNASTTINFSLPDRTHVTIEVYDITGRKIRTLVDEIRKSGSHKVTFNSDNISTGMYFYRMKAGQFEKIRKFTLLK